MRPTKGALSVEGFDIHTQAERPEVASAFFRTTHLSIGICLQLKI